MAEAVFAPGDNAEFDPVSSFSSLKTNLEAIFNRISPSGLIQTFAGSSAPSGWILCDGRSISRSTYSDLFAAIGTSYGAGDGSSTFTVPNLKGRTLVGLDAAQTEFNAIGKTGGAKAYQLTPEQNTLSLSVGSGRLLDPGNAAAGAGQVGLVEVAKGATQVNLQPYLVVNYIIKA